MKTLLALIGVLLIAGGIGTYVYSHVDYTDQKTVAQVGSVELTAKTEETLVIPPLASGAAVLAGLVLVVVGFRRKK